MSRTPSWPHTQPARTLLEKALRLLDDPTDANLREARRLTKAAEEWIPQLRADVNCDRWTRGKPTETCLSRSCGRCGPIRLAKQAKLDAEFDAE
ncbi:hypothetical protein [Streptomyces cyaneofuscatus]|uniref:hypothetical protein n=1 Tax=Streptomyces cyaneofuscatus TaxID=66883 RepID=UPI003426CE3B